MQIRQGRQTKALDIRCEKGPQIVEAKRGEPLEGRIKPYTEEVQREINWELVDHSVDFMKRQKAAGRPFFLLSAYLQTALFRTFRPSASRGHRASASSGIRLMEGDAIVGKMLDSLRELGLEKDTIVVFAFSTMGPTDPERAHSAWTCRTWIVRTIPRRARRRSRGAIRTARRRAATAGRITYRPGVSYAMFSIMDFFPTFARLAGGKVPADRPIDGVDQSDLLLDRNDRGSREHLLTLSFWTRPGRSALETISCVLCRRGARQERSRWRDAGRNWRQRSADEWLSQGIQCRG